MMIAPGMFSLLYVLVYWLRVQEGTRYSQDPVRDQDPISLIQSAVHDSQIEECLPQIATLLASTKVDGDRDVVERNRWIEQQVLQRCTANPHLSLKVYWLLRAALGHLLVPTRRGLPQITGEAQRRHLHTLLHTAERLAREGLDSPQSLRPLRARYFDHSTTFVSSLVRLSLDCKTVPPPRRRQALHQGLERVNNLLFRLMHTRGEEMETSPAPAPPPPPATGGMGASYPPPPPPPPPPPMGPWGTPSPGSSYSWLNDEHIARQCPEVAVHSVHFPLLDGINPVYRVLRLVSDECEVLPSRERCPYLILVELLQVERGTRCSSAKLYMHGANVGCTIMDALSGRQFPESMLYPDDLPYPRFPMKPFVCNERDDEEEVDHFWDINAYHGGPEDLHPRETDPLVRRAVTVRKVFGELWRWKEQRIRNSSPFGRLDGWRLASFIVKAGDDLRQEQVAMQVVGLCQEIFREEKLELWLRPYIIVCVGDQAGLLETIADAKSVDHIKKRTPYYKDLREYFERVYGHPLSHPFRQAQYNFMRSLAAYCIVTYLLQVKDRHNANILIDKHGHLIHIDFGFMLGQSPASFKWETAPFKLTKEYVEVLGGRGDPVFEHFRHTIIQGFQALSKPRHRQKIFDLLQVSIADVQDKASIIQQVMLRLDRASHPAAASALIEESFNNFKTTTYDTYQWTTNGIQP